jgi:oligoendopeptidase F
MLSRSETEKPLELEELKLAVKKLSEIYKRINALISRKQKSYVPSPLSKEENSLEDTERKVQHFGEALMSFLKLRKQVRKKTRVFSEGLKNLQEARDAQEICTLMGLTLLSDRMEYLHAVDGLMTYYEQELSQLMPEIVNAMALAGQINELGKWMEKLFNKDPKTGEDDLTRMIIAIRDRDISKFNYLYDPVERKIEVEETKAEETP